MSYYIHSRASLLKHISFQPKIVLEVGCAAGNFGKLLKEKFSCTVWGVEPVKKAGKQASEKLDKVYIDLYSRDLNLPTEHFDFITFNDVLEHMENPWEALNYSKELLTSEGKIMASIPNFFYFYEFIPFLLSKDWLFKASGIFDKTHLRFFTKKSMVRLFEESGYIVEKIEGIGKVKSRKIWLLNILTLGYCTDMYYEQYLVIAKKKV
ncbi:class I SAM-dependent methyltransferase [Reichenbachiella agariperforans]|uniref:class I SAM-dependent methyltransferase n=1 Tax=Reichenbachiella agariperforans TaxID=156994 RepID=UPI001C09E309|nr:class I SAM-dependent methyltransferase [Reichenbachiella agariperforans]MBU2915192.1 class I SAM-dependent methyltransferase [Reichenbachiella agariperforans]